MAIHTEQLLAVWERGRALNPVRQALALLAAAEPSTPAEDLAALTIGERDRKLFAARANAFGAQFACAAVCPSCGSRLESRFGASDIGLEEPSSAGRPFRLAAGEFEIECRAPNSADLLAVESAADPAAALLGRCILSVCRAGQPGPCAIPEALHETVADAIRERDPWSAIELAFLCPACGRHWTSLFDIVSFFWAELQAWAKRVLCEVHTIASVYGWREADILALHPLRRRAYIELIGQ